MLKEQPNVRAVLSTLWAGMLGVLLAMLVLEPLRHLMDGTLGALQTKLTGDHGTVGLNVLMGLVCVNVLVQFTVHARSCKTAKFCVLLLSVLYGLFFLVHNIAHAIGGEPIGIQTMLDLTHHALAAAAVWAAWRGWTMAS